MGLLDFLADNWTILLPPVLGLVAIYTLLPSPRRRPVLLGAGAAAVALLLSAFVVVRVGRVSSAEQAIEAILFYALAATAIIAGGLLVTQRNPARAALSFALVIIATSGLFLLQAAPFLMAATIIVYAGAIIVTFLFVLMLAQQEGLSDADARSREPFLASMTGFLLLIALLHILKITYKPDLDRWVRRSEERLADVQQLVELEKKESHQSEKRKPLIYSLLRFRADYSNWLLNETRGDDRADGNRDPKTPPKTPPLGASELNDALFNLESILPTDEDRMKSVDLEKVQTAMEGLVKAGKNARNDPQFGSLRPAGAAHMSELSGPASGRPSAELRRDDNTGVPQMPAENTTYLGRSLFTDFLLPVELAGTLLLVATIGAIAIAHRKDIEQRGTAASTNGSVPRRSA